MKIQAQCEKCGAVYVDGKWGTKCKSVILDHVPQVECEECLTKSIDVKR
jgi:hypothetical protein